MDVCEPDFEANDAFRSSFVRDITLHQLDVFVNSDSETSADLEPIPRTLVRYWHNPSELPDDVRACLDSWTRLNIEGFNFRMFSDESATKYIAEEYGARERDAFALCAHPAMRSDYMRMCFVLKEGGLYVDADDVLLGAGWKELFKNSKLKVQPLCYDIPTRKMVPASEIWRRDLPTDDRVFYVNNDPIAAPPRHPVLKRALARATAKLLGEDRDPEIQATTGPGNFTAALAAHVYHLRMSELPLDFELLRDWNAIAEMRWELSYRDDARNWRNVYGC